MLGQGASGLFLSLRVCILWRGLNYWSSTCWKENTSPSNSPSVSFSVFWEQNPHDTAALLDLEKWIWHFEIDWFALQTISVLFITFFCARTFHFCLLKSGCFMFIRDFFFYNYTYMFRLHSWVVLSVVKGWMIFQYYICYFDKILFCQNWSIESKYSNRK